MKHPFLALTACVCLGTALPAAAQFAKPEDAIKYRKAGLTVMAAHFGRVAAMANGRVPYDAKVAADNAEIASMVSRLPFAGFVPGSDKGDTKARPEVWSDTPGFAAAATKMQDEMAKLAATAKTGNAGDLRPAVGAVASACKACHDKYRQD